MCGLFSKTNVTKIAYLAKIIYQFCWTPNITKLQIKVTCSRYEASNFCHGVEKVNRPAVKPPFENRD